MIKLDIRSLEYIVHGCLLQDIPGDDQSGEGGDSGQDSVVDHSADGWPTPVTVSPLSSPRAESARAVTGRRCPHSGRGEDFLSRQPNFFTETAVTPERKVEKWFPRWEINRHAEG